MKNDRPVSPNIYYQLRMISFCSHVDVVWFIPEEELVHTVYVFPVRV